jgi:hypothetical protein
MKDYLHTSLKWVSHNRYIVLSLVLSAGLVGCAYFEPKAVVQSIDSRPLTEAQIKAALEAKQAEILADQRARQLKLDNTLASERAAYEAKVKNLVVEQTIAIQSDQAFLDKVNGEVNTAITEITKKKEFFLDTYNMIHDGLTLVNPQAGAVFGGVAGLLGIGALADKRRANKIIANQDKIIKDLNNNGIDDDLELIIEEAKKLLGNNSVINSPTATVGIANLVTKLTELKK